METNITPQPSCARVWRREWIAGSASGRLGRRCKPPGLYGHCSGDTRPLHPEVGRSRDGHIAMPARRSPRTIAYRASVVLRVEWLSPPPHERPSRHATISGGCISRRKLVGTPGGRRRNATADCLRRGALRHRNLRNEIASCRPHLRRQQRFEVELIGAPGKRLCGRVHQIPRQVWRWSPVPVGDLAEVRVIGPGGLSYVLRRVFSVLFQER